MIRAVLVAVALFAATGIAAAPVAEPIGLWTGALGGETPATLTGATVLDLRGLDRLIARSRAGKQPVLLDISNAPPRPAGLAADRPWLPVHRSVPGSVWLPGAGAGDIGTREADFARRVADLTGGDRTRPLVTFCQPHCWASWNAGKRLLGLGYTKIYWFPAGIVGWQAKHDTAVTVPDPWWIEVALGSAD